ncbi:hypothetical protein DFH09DRAFT_1070462 [Mycena vulgaris]|nr:hypothetical protein DFH09DRAFT_1070462 [Mycena vulgaris]
MRSSKPLLLPITSVTGLAPRQSIEIGCANADDAYDGNPLTGAAVNDDDSELFCFYENTGQCSYLTDDGSFIAGSSVRTCPPASRLTLQDGRRQKTGLSDTTTVSVMPTVPTVSPPQKRVRVSRLIRLCQCQWFVTLMNYRESSSSSLPPNTAKARYLDSHMTAANLRTVRFTEEQTTHGKRRNPDSMVRLTGLDIIIEHTRRGEGWVLLGEPASVTAGSRRSHLPVAAVVGSVVGALIILTMLCLAALFVRRRRIARSSATRTLEPFSDGLLPIRPDPAVNTQQRPRIAREKNMNPLRDGSPSTANAGPTSASQTSSELALVAVPEEGVPLFLGMLGEDQRKLVRYGESTFCIMGMQHDFSTGRAGGLSSMGRDDTREMKEGLGKIIKANKYHENSSLAEVKNSDIAEASARGKPRHSTTAVNPRSSPTVIPLVRSFMPIPASQGREIA